MAKANPWLPRLAILLGVAAVALGVYRWRRASQPKDFGAGGVELTYDVDVARALDERFARQLDEVVGKLRAAGVTLGTIRPQPRAATLQLGGADEAKLRDALAGTQLDGKLAPDGTATVSLAPEMAARLDDAAMQQAARVAHDRVEKLGVSAPTVRQVAHQLVIGLPGVDAQAAARAKEALAVPGRFEIRPVAETPALAAAKLPPGARAVPDRWRASDGKEHETTVLAGPPSLAEAMRAALPPLPGGLEAVREDAGAEVRFLPVRRAGLAGDLVADGEVREERGAGVTLALRLVDAAARDFAQLTGESVGGRIAFLVDGRVLAAPVVETPITGGRVALPLPGDPAAARRRAETLLLALRTGALPAPLTLAVEKEFGPKPER